MLRPELVAADLPDVLDQVINLASGDSHGPWRPPPAPKALIASSEVDLPLVTRRITEHLASDDDWTRHIGADAADVLLGVDATRIVALGDPLIASIRGPDAGYGGEALLPLHGHPTRLRGTIRPRSPTDLHRTRGTNSCSRRSLALDLPIPITSTPPSNRSSKPTTKQKRNQAK
jgi:hypothetical protein